MPNQRASGKRLIGAQASSEIWEGVDAWLRRNPTRTQSDFLVEACVEKLEREGIAIDQVAALRDRRTRVPYELQSVVHSGNYPRRSTRPNAAKGKDPTEGESP